MGEQTWAARFAMPLALVALLAGCCRGALAAESPRYVAVPLGSLGGGSSHATAINARGDVTGLSRTAGGEVHAFVLLNGVMRDLGTLGGPRSEAYSISAIGWTTGHRTRRPARATPSSATGRRWQASLLLDRGQRATASTPRGT